MSVRVVLGCKAEDRGRSRGVRGIKYRSQLNAELVMDVIEKANGEDVEQELYICSPLGISMRRYQILTIRPAVTTASILTGEFRMPLTSALSMEIEKSQPGFEPMTATNIRG